MIFLAILFFLLSASCTEAMDDSDGSDFYEEGAGIVSVPIEKYREYASNISQAMNENMNSTLAEADQSTGFSDEPLFQYDYTSETEDDEEVKEEKRVLLVNHQNMFHACERDICQTVCHFLRDRKLNNLLIQYVNLVQTQNTLPSQAALTIANQMLESPHYAYTATLLLECVLEKLAPSWNWNDAYGNEHMLTESRICGVLARYFRDTFNTIVEETHPSEPTAPLYTALRKSVRYLASDPDQSWDDIECPWSYYCEFMQRSAKNMAFWYIDKNGIPHQLHQNIDLSILNQARHFFETTSYGLNGSHYDLLHLLRVQNFICFEATEEQHIWIKYPFQVRIKMNGEVTAALIEDDPLKHKQLYGNVKKSTIESRKKTHELLKISSDGLDIAIVPAFIKEERFKEMWLERSDSTKQKDLMNRAHHWIRAPYLYFDRVTHLLNPPEPKQPQDQKKSQKQSGKKKKK